jgi:hypothetical protein
MVTVPCQIGGWTRVARSATPCVSRRRRRAPPAPASSCARLPHANAMPSPPARAPTALIGTAPQALFGSPVAPSILARPGRVNERRANGGHGGGPHRSPFRCAVGRAWPDRSGATGALHPSDERMIDPLRFHFCPSITRPIPDRSVHRSFSPANPSERSTPVLLRSLRPPWHHPFTCF